MSIITDAMVEAALAEWYSQDADWMKEKCAFSESSRIEMRATLEAALAVSPLIAAAPEMREALEGFYRDINGTRTVRVDFDANFARTGEILAALAAAKVQS